ncbi:phage tail tip fiber protein, partial [Proteus mirabilis]
LSENEVITKTNKVGQGNFWTQENLKAGHTYYFYIRTINSYGKSVFVEASGVPVSLPTDIFDDLDNTIRETEAFKQLSEELKWNTESIAVLTNATYSLSTDVLQRSANAQAGITQLQQLRVSDNEARAQEIKEIYSAVGENKSAIKETQTSITKLDEAFGQRFTAIRTDMDKAQADIISNSQAISNTNKAFAENKTQVQARFDEQEGMIEERMQATFEQTGDGVVTHSINITIVHNNVKYNAAGQVISAQVKNGKLESFIGYNANNFAWYNPVNGKMELFMYVKNGQMFMREAFINEAWLNSVVVTEYIKSGDYAPGKSGFLIDGKTSNIEMNKGIFRGELDIGTNKTGAHTVITNERIAVYGDKGEIRVEIGRILGR